MRTLQQIRTGTQMEDLDQTQTEDAAPLPTSYRPTAKVAAGGVAGAFVVVLVWGAGLLGVELPEAVAASLVSVASFAAAYFKKN